MEEQSESPEPHRRLSAAAKLVPIASVVLLLGTIVVGPARNAAAVSSAAATFVDISPDNEDTGFLRDDCPGSPTPCWVQEDGGTAQQDGGRVNGLAVVPDVPGTYFAASEVGGLFKSTNGGASWTHLDGHLPATTWDVAAAPGGQRVFATSFNEGRSDTAAVLQVSTDRGETWSGRLPPPPDDCAPVRAEQPSAFGIALRPGTSEVLVGTNCGLALSNNAGDSWTRFDPTPLVDPPSAVWDIVALPGGRTYACGDDGLLTSPDGQPGRWTRLGTPPLFPGGYCSLAVSPDAPDVVFIVVARGTWPGDGFGVGCCLFPVSGGGAEFYEGHVGADAVSWTRLPYPDADAAHDPSDKVTKKGRVPFVVTNKRSHGYDLWLGDGSLRRVPCSAQQTPNCDTAQWSGSFTDHLGKRTDAHGDSGDLEFDPAPSVDACPTLYSSDGGVYSNTDEDPETCDHPVFAGANKGLHAFLLWDMEGVQIDGVDAEDIYFATQDNGLYYTGEGGKCDPFAGKTCAWSHRTGGDEFDVAADETRVVASTGSDLRVADPGFPNPAVLISSGLGPAGVPGLVASVGSGEFMLVVGSGCCKDKDGVSTQIPVGVRDITSADLDNGSFGSARGSWTSSKPPCHIVVSTGPNGPQPYVLAGGCYWPNSREGHAFNADDELWTYREVAGVMKWDQITVPSGATGFGLIAVDPTNPDRLYASVVGGAPPRMVRSTDGGRHWADDDELKNLMSGNGTFLPYPGVDPPDGDQFTGGLWPYQQPLMVAFDPENPDILVAGGTSSGVFISSDGGDSWGLLTDPFTPGISGVPHLPRALWAHFEHDKPGFVRIYLGTGRGIWRVEIPIANLRVTKTAAEDPAFAGESITYTVRVANDGPSVATGVIVKDTMPAGVTYAAGPGFCNESPAGTLSCAVGALAAGSQTSFTITFDIAPNLVYLNGKPKTITNAVRVSGDQIDPNKSDSSATQQTLVIAKADTAIVSFAAVAPPSDVVVGKPIGLTLHKVITNHGPSSPVDVVVQRFAEAPPGSTVSPTVATKIATAVAKEELRTVDETFTITCGVPGPQTFRFGNIVYPARPADYDPIPDNNSSAVSLTVGCIVPVAINIKPGGFPNAVNLSGTAPVAVLTTQAGEYGLPLAFDATKIDPLSVHFGPASLVFSATGGATAIRGAGHQEDSWELDEQTRDGDLDMVLQFRVLDSGLTPSSTEACVKGAFVGAGGTSHEFFGCDSVKVAP